MPLMSTTTNIPFLDGTREVTFETYVLFTGLAVEGGTVHGVVCTHLFCGGGGRLLGLIDCSLKGNVLGEAGDAAAELEWIWKEWICG